MLKKFVLTAAAAALVSGGVAFAGTPFGGDDQGFVPPDKATAKCEDTATKNAGKLTSALITCHSKLAAAAFKDITKNTEDETCEKAAQDKATAVNAKLTNPPCPACLVNGLASGEQTTRDQVDLNGGVVYCEGTTQLGDSDDLGAMVPTDKNSLKCETSISKLADKFIGCILKCHIKAADSRLAGKVFDEEACEDDDGVAHTKACGNKYDIGVGKLVVAGKACNPSGTVHCAASSAPGLRSLILSIVDQRNAEAYCASPSGAFLN